MFICEAIHWKSEGMTAGAMPSSNGAKTNYSSETKEQLLWLTIKKLTC